MWWDAFSCAWMDWCGQVSNLIGKCRSALREPWRAFYSKYKLALDYFCQRHFHPSISGGFGGRGGSLGFGGLVLDDLILGDIQR